MTRTALLLFLSSCGTAVIHALIPDHWLPFVLLARVERWSEKRVVLLTGLAGSLHVVVTMLFGGLTIVAGSGRVEGLAERTGRSLGFLGGLILVVFGVSYGLWRHYREATAHARRGDLPDGSAKHLHAHGHLLERWFRGAVTARTLVVVIGISPCALLVPVLFASAVEGSAALLAAALGFALCTIGTMTGVTLFAVRGIRRIDLPFFTRYGDLISGALVAGVGLLMMLHEG